MSEAVAPETFRHRGSSERAVRVLRHGTTRTTEAAAHCTTPGAPPPVALEQRTLILKTDRYRVPVSAASRVRGPRRAVQAGGAGRKPGRIIPGAVVVLRRPWRLRGTRAIVRRRLGVGWEVEIRSALGTPMHLVVRTRALRRT